MTSYLVYFLLYSDDPREVITERLKDHKDLA